MLETWVGVHRDPIRDCEAGVWMDRYGCGDMGSILRVGGGARWVCGCVVGLWAMPGCEGRRRERSANAQRVLGNRRVVPLVILVFYKKLSEYDPGGALHGMLLQHALAPTRLQPCQ